MERVENSPVPDTKISKGTFLTVLFLLSLSLRWCIVESRDSATDRHKCALDDIKSELERFQNTSEGSEVYSIDFDLLPPEVQKLLIDKYGGEVPQKVYISLRGDSFNVEVNTTSSSDCRQRFVH